MRISRRSLIGAGLKGAAVAAVGLPVSALSGKRKEARNIIFCVSDGMAMSTLTMANHLSRIRDGKPSYWADLMARKGIAVNGLQETRSLNSVVTDSSAASSAWGSGRRIWNGQVNMFPDGTELKTLTRIMSEAGVRCGLVTTTTITHATPAGFAVNATARGLEAQIAEKYLNSGVDVLLGGGERFFPAALRERFSRAGFHVVTDKSSLSDVTGGKILGIFSDSHLPYTIDRLNDPELDRTVPTLAGMSRKAVETLRGSSNGFLLQIEGGKVDHAGHSNDLAGLVYDQIEFEDAVRFAVEFALEDGETLVIVTSDHACGGPGLNAAGPTYDDSNAGLESILKMRATYGALLSEIGESPSFGRVRDVVEHRLAIQLGSGEAQTLADAIGGESPFGASIFHRDVRSALGMILGNHTKVTWTSLNHTSDHVMVTAVGPGAEEMFGLTDNTTFFDLMLRAKGLSHRNPTMTYEEAARHRGGASTAHPDELFAEIA